VLANKGACANTYGGADGGTDDGALGVLANDLSEESAKTCSTCTTEDATGAGAGATSHYHQCTHNVCNKISLFHLFKFFMLVKIVFPTVAVASCH
jgi:hypothetical protein